MGVKRLEGRMEAAAMAVAQALKEEAAERTPVLEGELRDGWRVGSVEKVGSEYRVTVENDVPYAAAVEYGHRAGSGWVPGQFFLKSAEESVARRAAGIVKGVLGC